MASTSTLREVADMAGVSIGTASQALNNRPNVSPETRSRVLDAAITLGYHKESHGNLEENAISIIGMLVKHDYGLDVTVNPFYPHIERGIERECRKRNIGLMYSAIEVDHQNRPVIWPSMISEQRIDGLLLIGTFIEDTIDMIQDRLGLPIVLIDSYASHLPFDSVLIDNTVGATSAINYLIGLGHQHIGLIGSNPESPPGVFERRLYYQKTLQVAGIPYEYIVDSELQRASAYDAARHLLKSSPQVTAIFSVNDDSAIGVMNAVHDMGLRVPEDVSVIGFDNIDVAKEVTPALTTVHVHKSWLGILGVRNLIDRIQNPDQPRIITTVTTQIIERDSVCAPRSMVFHEGGA
jgi:LacI family transcriptional regulator, galactose operon repressor